MAGQSGPTTLTTILPAAVFGPVLTRENLGSVQLIARMLKGQPPGLPRVGFNVIDVRDLADLHVRAMTVPEAAGQRFLAAGEHLWMRDVARVLRDQLGARASKVPTREWPNAVFRLLSIFVRPLKALTPMLGRKHEFLATKAGLVLGFTPRPAAETVVDCAESLLAGRANPA